MPGPLTDRGKGLVLAAAALWLAGRAVGSAELVMGAAACLALVGLAVAHTRAVSLRLAVDRRVRPNRLSHEEDGQVELSLRNRGRLPTATLELRDAAPADLADRPRFTVPPLAPGEATTLRYPLHGRRRGRHPVGPLTAMVSDPFGVATRTRRLGHPAEVVVYPPVWHLPAGVPLAGRAAGGRGGRRRPAVTGTEVASVREYVRGDALRKVHWPSTAHRGRLMVRQDEAADRAGALLLLDTRGGVHRGTGPLSSLEVTVAAAASIGHHLAERGLTVRAVTPGGDSPAPGWPGTLEHLAVLEPSPAASLLPAWRGLAGSTGRAGILVAVLAPPTPGELHAMVRAGHRFPTRLAVLVDTTSYGGPAGETDLRPHLLRLRAAGWRATSLAAGERLPAVWPRLLVRTRPPVTAAGGWR